MKYSKFRWSENRGDEFSHWGFSWLYMEHGPDGYPTRQVEVYDNGKTLRYGPDHDEDQFGFLSYAHEDDLDWTGSQMITAAEFEAIWQSAEGQ
jgi:hypothetical protein